MTRISASIWFRLARVSSSSITSSLSCLTRPSSSRMCSPTVRFTAAVRFCHFLARAAPIELPPAFCVSLCNIRSPGQSSMGFRAFVMFAKMGTLQPRMASCARIIVCTRDRRPFGRGGGMCKGLLKPTSRELHDASRCGSPLAKIPARSGD